MCPSQHACGTLTVFEKETGGMVSVPQQQGNKQRRDVGLFHVSHIR